MTVSPFTVGTVCAKWTMRSWGGNSLEKVTVHKVRKDGKFYVSVRPNISLPEDGQMWKPQGDTAHKTGSGGFYRSWLEVWTEKHDAHLAEEREQLAAEELRNAVLEQVRLLDRRMPKDRVMLAAVLGLLNRPE